MDRELKQKSYLEIKIDCFCVRDINLTFETWKQIERKEKEQTHRQKQRERERETSKYIQKETARQANGKRTRRSAVVGRRWQSGHFPHQRGAVHIQSTAILFTTYQLFQNCAEKKTIKREIGQESPI